MAAAAVDTTSSFSVHPAPKSDQSPAIKPTQSDLSKRTYIRWDAEGVEKKPPNEDENIAAVVEQINTIQRANRSKTGRCFSGTHAKTQSTVKGTFEVFDDLPQHLKQGELFSKGGSYPAACRYSTEPGDPVMDDRVPNPRGFAMKLFNVHGDFFDAGKDFPTQDIEFNSTPALDLANAKVTKEIIDLRLAHGADQKVLTKHLEARDDAELQTARDKVRVTHLESTRQYSQTAYRYGDYIIKYCLVPSSETQQKLFDETVRPEHGPDILHQWLRDFHSKHDAEYLFQVQLCENLDDQPVEYAGKIWDPEKYPWQTVGALRIPKQDSCDQERRDFWELHMRVDPWHGLKAYQPLGGSNRLRKVGKSLKRHSTRIYIVARLLFTDLCVCVWL